MKRSLFLSVIAVAVLSGCALFKSPVPTTEISGTIAGQKFSLSNPKNTSVSNLVVEVTTNATARLSIGSLVSANDSNVIAGSYAGQADLVRAAGEQLNQAFQNGAVIAGKFVGAAK